MTNYDFSRVLTTGASGMIGSYVDFGIRVGSKQLDITDRDAVLKFVRKRKPRAIIHLAGATDMKRCERDPMYAFSLNTIGTYNVARAARDVGAVLVYVSSSRVFSGTKKSEYTVRDIPAPEGNYGHSKYLGEVITKAIVPKHIIVRTCWVFGGGPSRDTKFYGKILKQLAAAKIEALDDVRGSPTYGKDLIAAIKDMLAQGKYGTVHVGNAGTASRYRLARFIASHLKSGTKVRAVNRARFKSTHLPANESIRSSYPMRPWKKALAEYIDEEWKSLRLKK